MARNKHRVYYKLSSNEIVGIDPGQEGGIAVIDSSGILLEIYRMPRTELECCMLIRDISERYTGPRFCIERSQAMPGQGVTSMFNYGKGYGALRGAILVLGNTLEDVSPLKWKNAIIGKNTGGDKALSIAKAQLIFPGIELIPGRCRTPQDGMAEAALIAEWARRNIL